jgi:poly(hydroxyalkanoate) depolymerase family esterase
MRRLVVLVALLALVPAVRAQAAPDLSTRPYRVFRPAHPNGALIVYLHGCTQTAKDAEDGTRWDATASKYGITMVFPEQLADANGAQCWNWFEPAHQARGAGEPAIIASITKKVVATYRIDPKRVYLMGVSAGADMTTVLGATYPDLFAAIAPFAGCAYATCADVTGSLARQAMGPHLRQMPAMIVQGTGDMLNNAALGETAVQQWVNTNQLGRLPSSEDHGSFTEVAPGSGDPCVRNAHFPCAGGVLGWTSYPYTIHHYGTSKCHLVDAWYIHGLNHDYPSGRPESSFTDPIGPDINEAAWAFFQHHRVGHPCAA